MVSRPLRPPRQAVGRGRRSRLLSKPTVDEEDSDFDEAKPLLPLSNLIDTIHPKARDEDNISDNGTDGQADADDAVSGELHVKARLGSPPAH